MVSYHLTGHVGDDGKLRVELPEGVPPGEVEVIITVSDSLPEDADWTDDELREMMHVTPKTGAEIAALLAEMEAGYRHITDSAAWVEEHRRSQRERAQW